jgi:hypothetical protein
LTPQPAARSAEIRCHHALSWIYDTFEGAVAPLCAGLTLEWIQLLIDFFSSGALAWRPAKSAGAANT